MSLIIFVFSCLALGLGGWWVSKTHFKSSIIDRLLSIVVLPFSASLIYLYIYRIFRAVEGEKNFMRLANTIAYFKGIDVYSSLNSGPMVTSIYGPVSFLMFWPATLATNPMVAVHIAEALSISFCLIPVFMILFHGMRGFKCNLYAWAIFLLFACFPHIVTSLKSAFFNIHADAPALCLSALACGVLYLSQGKNKHCAYVLSAFFSVASLWCKQVVAPIIVALILFVWIQNGKKGLSNYLLRFLVWLGIFTGGFIFIFGAEDLYFNMVTIPSTHPLTNTDPQVIVYNFWKIIRECLTGLIFLMILLFPRMGNRKYFGALFKFVFSGPIKIFTYAFIFMIPATLYVIMKIGSSNNTFAYTTYFFLIIGALTVKETLILESLTKNRGRGIKTTLFLATLVMGIVMTFIAGFRIYKNVEINEYAKEGYKMALKYPEKYYYPNLPLIHLYAEGKLYHTTDGLRDRKWSKLDFDDNQFYRHTPSHMKWVAFASENHLEIVPMTFVGAEIPQEEKLSSFNVQALWSEAAINHP